MPAVRTPDHSALAVPKSSETPQPAPASQQHHSYIQHTTPQPQHTTQLPTPLHTTHNACCTALAAHNAPTPTYEYADAYAAEVEAVQKLVDLWHLCQHCTLRHVTLQLSNTLVVVDGVRGGNVSEVGMKKRETQTQDKAKEMLVWGASTTQRVKQPQR